MLLTKTNVLQGQSIVDLYRLAHTAMHLKFPGGSKELTGAHKLLTDKLISDIKDLGYSALDGLWKDVDGYSIEDLRSLAVSTGKIAVITYLDSHPNLTGFQIYLAIKKNYPALTTWIKTWYEDRWK